MKALVNGTNYFVSVFHLNAGEFIEKFPHLVGSTCLNDGVMPRRITVAQVTNSANDVKSFGISVCHKNDSFKRRTGFNTSVGRAMRNHTNLAGKSNKAVRKEIYHQLLRATPSPYTELQSLVKGNPTLARKLVEYAKNL